MNTLKSWVRENPEIRLLWHNKRLNKRWTYTALSHFNLETRHGAHERSTLDLLDCGAAVPPGLISIESIVEDVTCEERNRLGGGGVTRRFSVEALLWRAQFSVAR
jgi:hypothetical protein